MGKGRKARDTELSFVTPPLRVMEESPKTVVHPTKFFGEPGEDVEKWLKSFDRISKANGWSERRQIEILPAFLRDRAAEFYDELPDSQQSDWEELKNALIDHFLPKEARRFYYADLYARKQGTTESAEDFGRVIQQLVRRAYTEMPLEHQATLMREHFVNGLRPALKRIVLISDPSDFNKAVEVAKREEINDHVVNGTAPWTQTFCSTERPVAPVAGISNEKHLQDRIHRLENAVEKLTTALTETKISPGPPNYGRRYNWSSDRNLRSTDGRPICNFCKKVGHYERECRSKRSFYQKPKN